MYAKFASARWRLSMITNNLTRRDGRSRKRLEIRKGSRPDVRRRISCKDGRESLS